MLELAVAMTAMLFFIIFIISFYLSKTIYDNIKEEMYLQADYIINHYPSQDAYNEQINNSIIKNLFNSEVFIRTDKEYHVEDEGFKPLHKNENYYLEYKKHYTNSNLYITIKQNITHEQNLIDKIYLISIILLFIGVLFIAYYADLLSKKLMEPLKQLTYQFTNMNESLLHHVNTETLPIEFVKLAESVNLLVTKIKTFLNYRKELYIGTAHELKTPLAVMRLKNQITLMKYKKQDGIKEALEQNITSIDTLNAMIHNLLEYGRSEGAQFEQPQRVNLIRLMATKAEEYELLAHSQERDFIYHFSVEAFRINVQPLLFMQIFQNFIQNALRFTPKDGLVSLQTRMDSDNFIIEIIDEGPGIDTKKDLFAPFQRSLESTGAGLGLFLAQNAAESMGVNIELKNRIHDKGAIASIVFPLNRFLLKDD